ncbi:MAG: CPBP family glutamic-type intramembrane protease [Terracidiphilus sp.]
MIDPAAEQNPGEMSPDELHPERSDSQRQVTAENEPPPAAESSATESSAGLQTGCGAGLRTRASVPLHDPNSGPVPREAAVPAQEAPESAEPSGDQLSSAEHAPDAEPAPDALIAEEPATAPLAHPPSILFAPPQALPRPQRIPHVGHVGLFLLLFVAGGFGSGLLTALMLRLHVFGVARLQDAAYDVRYALGSQLVLYLIAFGLSLILFPPLWNEGYFRALEWNGRIALSLRWRLVAAAFTCFVLALVNGLLMPSPENTPIDKLLRSPGAPWLLFAFGVTCAPFFEELAFRGFLLPALSTAADWMAERLWSAEPQPLDPAGHPRWSVGSMIIASICTSIPFALMHAEQTGHALGPFLLLVGVSLVLCWTRLATRSLAASVLVHACYNFLLFSLMLLGTGGFRHLDKM